MQHQPCVYILTNRFQGALYADVTSDLVQRLIKHHTHSYKRFTNKYGITQLVYYESHKTMREAIKRENAIKKWCCAWKIELIERTNPKWANLPLAVN